MNTFPAIGTCPDALFGIHPISGVSVGTPYSLQSQQNHAAPQVAFRAARHSLTARWRCALVIGLLAMGVAACGGGGGTSSSAGEIARTGKVLVPVGNGSDYGQSVSVQPDRRLLLAGYSRGAGNWDFSLIRLNADGSLDTGFASNGKIVMDIGSNTDDHGYSITVQSDRKIVVAGSSFHYDGGSTGSGIPTGYNIFALMRFNADGTVDSSFGSGGKLVTDFGRDSEGLNLTMQPDGKILVAGYSNSDFAVTRYNPDGSLDSSFGSGGKVVTNFGSLALASDEAHSIILQPDGKIVVSGTSNSGGTNNFAVARYNPDGNLDSSFGSAGEVVTDFGSGKDDAGLSVTLQPDGKIVVAGESHSGASSDFAVARYNSDGSLDASFGNGGKLVTHIGSGAYDGGRSIALQPDGKILVAGFSDSGNYWNFAVVRYNLDGSLDSTFGSNGARVVDIGGNGYDIGQSITVQHDGRIVVGGYSRLAGGDFDFSLIRLTPDGNLDTTFGEVATNINK